VFVCLIGLSALVGSARAEERTRLEITGIWVGGQEIRTSTSEIVYVRPGTMQITLHCRPDHPEALYSYYADWQGEWSRPTPEATLRLDSPPAGFGRLQLAAASPGGVWVADTLALTLRASPANSAADTPASASGKSSRLPLVLASVFVLVAAAAAGFWLWRRRRSGRLGGIPRGAMVVVDGGSASPGGRPVAVPDVPSRRPSSAETAGQSARERELEEELEYLRGRIQELLAKTRDLKRMNWELREKCTFLERTNDELRELHRRKEEVLATLVHDIKNPAGAIQALAEILKSYDLSAQEQQKMIEDILAVSARIIKLSQDMSEAMVSEVKNLPLTLSIGPIKPLVEEICQMNQTVAKRKGIAIQAVVPQGLPDIEMDSARIEEVVDNLIGNAIKYSRTNTKVLVEVKATPSHVTIDVIDQGLGMSQADVDQAFQMGRTLSARPTAGESSTGMGLWIVRKIVEAHRGLVWVRSTPGKGSTFSIVLPTRQTRSA
jgi:signal transduction histidine kinase